MAQNEITTNSSIAAPAEDDDALKKRLLSRIAIAGIAIVGLLGSLAVYDSLNRSQQPVPPKMAAVPEVPVAEEPKADEEKPVEAEPAAETKPAEAAPAEASKVAAAEESVPERSETPLAPPPKSLTKPAKVQQASVKPSAPAHAPPSRPLARETTRSFLVQVGVFSNHANATELLEKLQAAGIPARIESRVQVGPFASRAEAAAASAKLKALGIDDSILVRR